MLKVKKSKNRLIYSKDMESDHEITKLQLDRPASCNSNKFDATSSTEKTCQQTTTMLPSSQCFDLLFIVKANFFEGSKQVSRNHLSENA